jgi:hypothetical protein
MEHLLTPEQVLEIHERTNFILDGIERGADAEYAEHKRQGWKSPEEIDQMIRELEELEYMNDYGDFYIETRDNKKYHAWKAKWKGEGK